MDRALGSVGVVERASPRPLVPLGAMPGASLTGKGETRTARQVGVVYGLPSRPRFTLARETRARHRSERHERPRRSRVQAHDKPPPSRRRPRQGSLDHANRPERPIHGRPSCACSTSGLGEVACRRMMVGHGSGARVCWRGRASPGADAGRTTSRRPRGGVRARARSTTPTDPSARSMADHHAPEEGVRGRLECVERSREREDGERVRGGIG
jgi:hypothetical protein